MSAPQSLSIGGRLGLGFKALVAVGSGLGSLLLYYPWTRNPKAQTPFKHFVYTVFRNLTASISAAQEQVLVSSTIKEYKTFAAAKGIPCRIDTLKHDAEACWIGDRNAEKIILYFHGGGYVMGASPGHLGWVYGMQTALQKQHACSVSIVMVAFTLAPAASYPTQLRQAVAALDWVLNDLGKKPKDVLLLGDSAGGQLALAVVSHVLHKHPAIDTTTRLDEPLAGLAIISPLIDFRTDYEAFSRNAMSDMVAPSTLKRWADLFLGGAELDEYNQPRLADDSWFQGLDNVVNSILVWGGEREVLIDSIRELHVKLSKAQPRATLTVDKGSAHEEIVMDAMLGYAKSSAAKEVENWVTAQFQ